MHLKTLIYLILLTTNGRGSRVVWASGHGLPCHEFEPSTTEARHDYNQLKKNQRLWVEYGPPPPVVCPTGLQSSCERKKIMHLTRGITAD
ncbi:hypothetical protein TNCV_4078861 [Trichonephila clavipes]|nr:hypothetical protein TNCV_4078861 [Trichonephila clavipes]